MFAALVTAGAVEVPLERTAWADLIGAGVDRYGVHWMVDDTGEAKHGSN